eukprot:CAMPEP_0172801282 /NCGR_PEP_ID=MMETSP1075-20121228/3095_1 /TAXON_ID=2916 /ORGANISM="Ceratium fusus, Strain PA161109" /LENGTH=183 /DNA_ID=CAMNT_0013639305 /DNA_START=94 /DNA_END=645 /DNA_ORIENTATION=+
MIPNEKIHVSEAQLLVPDEPKEAFLTSEHGHGSVISCSDAATTWMMEALAVGPVTAAESPPWYPWGQLTLNGHLFNVTGVIGALSTLDRSTVVDEVIVLKQYESRGGNSPNAKSAAASCEPLAGVQFEEPDRGVGGTLIGDSDRSRGRERRLARGLDGSANGLIGSASPAASHFGIDFLSKVW